MENNRDFKDLATYQEISSQPGSVAAAVAAVSEQADRILAIWSERQYRQIIVTGCGSTYFLSIGAASLFQMLTGITARAAPASELLLDPKQIYATDAAPVLLVAVSRSGATSETLRAVQSFQKAALGDVLTITCSPDNDLSRMGRVNIVLTAAAEKSVAQTRSFSSMWVAACTVAGTFVQERMLLDQLERLPEVSRRVTEASDEPLRSLGSDLSLDRIYFLGSGFRHGLAREASLKMKEMSLTHAEAFHFMEFRHGPMSMVDENTLIVGLLSDDPHGHERAVLTEMQALGARLLLLSEAEVQGILADSIIFDSGLDEIVRSALYMPPFQYLALGRAVAKGVNPDQPRNLTAVVYLDNTYR